MLADQREAFSTALDRLTGRTEWGVKVYTDPTAPGSPPSSGGNTGGGTSADSGAGGGTGGAGKAYLRRRLAQRRSREDSWQRATELSRRIDQVLGDLAEDRRHHRPQDAALSGAPGENVFNAAYLVPADRSAEFAARARELACGLTGVRVELTGPWVPYSFVPQAFTPNGSGTEVA